MTISPLDKPLEVLRAALGVTAVPSDLYVNAEASTSSKPYYFGGASSTTQSEGVLTALKRVKHALIGNLSRKLDLAKRIDDVAGIASLVAIGDSPSAISVDLFQHQIFLQASDILASLAVARRECLIVLLDLRLHETLLRTIENLVHVNQQHENGTDEAWPSTHLHQKLLHAIRALKSLYVAIINLIDPLGAQLSMSELVLTSAYARSKALGLSTASGPTNSNGPVNTSSKASKSSSSRSNAHSISTMWPSQTPSTATLADIARVADQMFLHGEAVCLLKVLYLSRQHDDDDGQASHSRAQSRLPADVYTSQQITIQICDMIATCIRTAAQREAIYEAQSICAEDTGRSGDEWDPFLLLSGTLETAPSQVAESVVRAMTALMKTYGPRGKRGVRIPSSRTWQNDHDMHVCMEDRMASSSPSMRLAAAEWHVAVYKNFRSLNVEWDAGAAPVIAVLLHLLSDVDPAISARAGFTIASFVTGNKSFQEIASNMDAFQRIRQVQERLAMPVEPYETDQAALERSRQQQATLLAASALSNDIEDLRRKVVDVKLLPFIIWSLSSPFPNVRCAAAQCTRSLSRSINIIKTALVDTHAAPAFLELLKPGEDCLTQLAILAVICNALIEFSPLKTVLLETEGLVERIVDLTKVIKPARMAGTGTSGTGRLQATPTKQSLANNVNDNEGESMMEVKALLRHHALTAIKNMTYWSSSALKIKTVSCLTWEYAVALLRDPDLAVRTEMLNILRNIACNEAADIELVVRGIGEARLFSLIEESLHLNRDQLVEHSLYLVSNIATGTDGHRAAIMNRLGIIRALLAQLSNPSSEIRVAAVWSVNNLCQRGGQRRYSDNAQRLRSLGFEARLKEMREDPVVNVRERVADALEGCFDPDPAAHSMIVD